MENGFIFVIKIMVVLGMVICVFVNMFATLSMERRLESLFAIKQIAAPVNKLKRRKTDRAPNRIGV